MNDHVSTEDEATRQQRLNNLVDSINKVLGPYVTARIEGEEALIECNGIMLWLDTDCQVSGEGM